MRRPVRSAVDGKQRSGAAPVVLLRRRPLCRYPYPACLLRRCRRPWGLLHPYYRRRRLLHRRRSLRSWVRRLSAFPVRQRRRRRCGTLPRLPPRPAAVRSAPRAAVRNARHTGRLNHRRSGRHTPTGGRASGRAERHRPAAPGSPRGPAPERYWRRQSCIRCRPARR